MKIASDMKRGTLRLPAALMLVVATLMAVLGGTSCRKDYINGDLDGIWEVKEIIDNGETRVPDERRFMRFEFHVCQLSGWQDAFPTGSAFTNGNMVYNGSELILEFPFVTDVEGMKTLSTWGIMTNPVTFTVKSIDSNRMTLEAGDVTLRLIKF